MLHDSFLPSRFNSRRNSDETSSHCSRKPSVSPSGLSPTHSLLRRATSKTAKGSSIIRRDGSIILTKNGKIISVRPDTSAMQRDRSFQKLNDTRQEEGKSKSLTDINSLKQGDIEITPLLVRTSDALRSSTSLSSRPSSIHSSSSRIFHSSLTKIDSVDETEQSASQTENELKPPTNRSVKAKLSIKEHKDKQSGIKNSTNIDTNGPELETDLCLPSSPVTIKVFSDDTESTSYTSGYKTKTSLKNAKSENALLELTSAAENDTRSKVNMSKSSNDVFTVPILRYPSVERLDTQVVSTRRSSDAIAVRKLAPRSPLYKRRWLSNKSIQDDQTKTK